MACSQPSGRDPGGLQTKTLLSVLHMLLLSDSTFVNLSKDELQMNLYVALEYTPHNKKASNIWKVLSFANI